jgi:hypothetical protein
MYWTWISMSERKYLAKMASKALKEPDFSIDLYLFIKEYLFRDAAVR